MQQPSCRLKPLAYGAALGCAAMMTALPAASVQAQPVRQKDIDRDIDIAAKPLDAALNDLAQQVGTQIVIDSDDARGHRSRPLKGVYTVGEALDMLLTPAGLSYRYLNDRTIAVVPNSQVPEAGGKSPARRKPAPEALETDSDIPDRSFRRERFSTIAAADRLPEEIIVSASVPTRNRTRSIAPELVYDNTFFQRFEPLSVGDALKRVPGISFSTDVGEFDDPGFRGLANGFTQILINGKPVTSAGGPDGTSRSVFVDRIPAELIERIEVIRSPSANIDSQGIAGTINIVLKEGASLPEGGYVRGTGILYTPSVSGNDSRFRGGGAVGYAGKALDDRLIYSLNANVQQRFNNKFTVQEVFDPDNFANVDAAIDALGIRDGTSIISDGEERTIQNDVRDNTDIALSGDMTYRSEAGHVFEVSAFFINTDREEREDELVFEDAPDNLVAVTAQEADFDQENYGLSAAASFELSATTRLNVRAALNRFDNRIEETDFELDAEDIDGPLPTETAFRDSFTVAPFNPDPDELEIFDIDDQEWQLSAGIESELSGLAKAFGVDAVTLETGVQVRLRDRDSALQVFGFDDGVPDIDNPEPSDLGGVFSLQENRYDGYVLVDWQVSDRMSLETGARFEYTETDQDGFADGAAVSATSDDFDFNPSAHLRYRLANAVTLRASYARTVRRPDFNERIPFLLDDQPDDLDTITGNPDLEFETSNGFDLGFEFDLPGGGVFGVNGFYRDISNLIQLINLGANGEIEDDDGDLIVGDAFTFENVGDAEVYGIEFDVSTPLTFLNLPDTGLFGNFTLLRSSADNAFAGTDGVRLNDQPRYVYNVGMTHSFRPQGVTLGFSYQKQGRSRATFFDEFEETRFSANLEAFVEKRLGDSMVVRLSGNNLLDANTIQAEQGFDGPITGGDLDNFEIERETAQPRVQLTFRAVF
ncbi:TonB-dependent receptor [Eilatimonas milleporae]|nr:TonB-dependent receptor [Eilatimonas milleporae]